MKKSEIAGYTIIIIFIGFYLFTQYAIFVVCRDGMVQSNAYLGLPFFAGLFIDIFAVCGLLTYWISNDND